jgi:hypothetical protein
VQQSIHHQLTCHQNQGTPLIRRQRHTFDVCVQFDGSRRRSEQGNEIADHFAENRRAWPDLPFGSNRERPVVIAEFLG